MKNSTLIHEVTPDQLVGLFKQIQNQLTTIKENFQPVQPTEYLTRAEVAKLLKCDISSVHNWTVKGKLRSYGISGRVYYKRSEVEQALTPLNAA